MFLTRNIYDYISNKHIYFIRDIYYKCEPHKLEINHFSNTIAFNDLKCAFLPLTVNLPSWSSG